jgi:ribosome-associated protein
MGQVKISAIKKEIEVLTSRSGGPGGQHANKVETKVTLRWNVPASQALSDRQKETLQELLSSKLTTDGVLILSADKKRSQLKNKEIAFKKLDRILSKALTPQKKRIATKPSKTAKRKRLDKKKQHSDKKALRKRIL